MTPETKKNIQLWIGSCLIAALVFYLFFSLGKRRGEMSCSKISNSSTYDNQIQSKIEAVKWKFKYDSVSVEYAKVMAGVERKINNSNKKIKANEITKKQDAALSDSLAYKLRDSLRAEYRKRFVR